ncbi:unnamed protein product [Protopolystoma xenopodis]|uniref:Uncharacterized protein n=1 Tax=Protopolystoma xenopodis TaxID=117903 RepID=A0A3S4ZCR4_9PLAT|nr:unnamed protein product [Protopolystoma xenopodis]
MFHNAATSLSSLSTRRSCRPTHRHRRRHVYTQEHSCSSSSSGQLMDGHPPVRRPPSRLSFVRRPLAPAHLADGHLASPLLMSSNSGITKSNDSSCISAIGANTNHSWSSRSSRFTGPTSTSNPTSDVPTTSSSFVSAACLSSWQPQPPEALLISGSADTTLKLWRLSATASWSRIACAATLQGHTDTVRCVQVCFTGQADKMTRKIPYKELLSNLFISIKAVVTLMGLLACQMIFSSRVSNSL